MTEGNRTRTDRRAALAAWDRAVALWRANGELCLTAGISSEVRQGVYEASVSSSMEFIEVMGGYAAGVDCPAAVALGWA